MKTILVDAIYGLILEDGTVFQEMYDLLETFSNKKVLLTGASGERFKEFGLDKSPYPVFTLAQDPPKSDPKYYQMFLEQYGLTKDDVVYFEHNKEAVKSAESLGIKTHFYDQDKKDLVALKNFLTENL